MVLPPSSPPQPHLSLLHSSLQHKMELFMLFFSACCSSDVCIFAVQQKQHDLTKYNWVEWKGYSYVYQLQERERESGLNERRAEVKEIGNIKGSDTLWPPWWRPEKCGSHCSRDFAGVSELEMSPLKWRKQKKDSHSRWNQTWGPDSARSSFIKLTVKLFCYQETRSLLGLG